MRIIEPSFEILFVPDLPMLRLEQAGRVCYKSESKITKDSADTFVKKIIESGHHSVIEHTYISVKIICDRGVSHEIVRHRLASYSQESTRYCNYSKNDHITYIKPCFLPDIPIGEFDLANSKSIMDCKSWLWIHACEFAENTYNGMIAENMSPQEARSVLPNSLKTEIVMTCNLREWRHFFTLRTSKKAHPQMREIARPMLNEFKNRLPVVFGDINYDN